MAFDKILLTVISRHFSSWEIKNYEEKISELLRLKKNKIEEKLDE